MSPLSGQTRLLSAILPSNPHLTMVAAVAGGSLQVVCQQVLLPSLQVLKTFSSVEEGVCLMKSEFLKPHGIPSHNHLELSLASTIFK